MKQQFRIGQRLNPINFINQKYKGIINAANQGFQKYKNHKCCKLRFSEEYKPNKIITSMNIIDKDQTETFGGWANEFSSNDQEIILANILKRKSTMSSLPPLNDLKIRNSSQQHLQNHLKLQPMRLKNIQTKQQKSKGVRLKTEGFNQLNGDAISPLKKKLVEILNQQQTKNNPCPIIQEQAQENKSQLTQFQAQPNQQQHFYTKYKLNRISKNQLQNERLDLLIEDTKDKKADKSMKKTHSKLYVKLNALQMLNDFKKNVYRQAASIHNLTSKNRFTLDNTQNPKTKTHKNILMKKYQPELKVEKLEKINEKLKQTFVKLDVFEKEKKKKQKIQRLQMLTQFNDQLIFSNSPLKIADKILTKRQSPLKTIQKGSKSRPDLSIPIKFRKRNSPHHYKFTIN